MKRTTRYWVNLLTFTLAVLLLLALGTLIGLTYARAMTLVHPARTQPTITPSDYGIVDWETVNFTTTDGLRLQGWFITPDSATQNTTLIFVHGLGSNRGGLLEQAAMLQKYGYGALLFDLRNHGQSQGKVTTLGYREIYDIQGAVEYLKSRPEVNPHRIGLVGISMGAGTVIRAAAHIPSIRFVIAQAAFTSLEDNLENGIRSLLYLRPFPFAPLVVWFGECAAQAEISAVRPIDDIPNISPRPILIIHGEMDTIIPVENAHQLFQAAEDPKYLYISPNAGHGGFLQADAQIFEKTILDFLNLSLR